ncbi:unnamed protein product [Lampetra planeri]
MRVDGTDSCGKREFQTVARSAAFAREGGNVRLPRSARTSARGRPVVISVPPPRLRTVALRRAKERQPRSLPLRAPPRVGGTSSDTAPSTFACKVQGEGKVRRTIRRDMVVHVTRKIREFT